MDRIRPCLWYDGQAEEAAQFYVSVFPESRIGSVNRFPMDWPGGKAGDVVLVEFTLFGQSYQALNGGPDTAFNESVSLSVRCRDQEELDRFWEALLAGGGAEIQCGWLKDRYGLRWQVVPEEFEQMMGDADEAQAARLMTAMVQMIKLDMDALRAAWEG